MDRKAVAKETLEIMRQGYYLSPGGVRIELEEGLKRAVGLSQLITPEQGAQLMKEYEPKKAGQGAKKEGREEEGLRHGGGEKGECRKARLENISTVDAIRKLDGEGKAEIGVLNFASAKNPGGGFLNGAMAQEESLAASSTLYRTLIAHEEYYRENRARRSMVYTDHAIYSPDVVFFRDGKFRLTDHPVKASVLTLPAVNMGQVIRKGEDVASAQQAMRRRMALALAIFASKGAKNLVLGAYGCGVFGNDPGKVAVWWRELLEEGMAGFFDSVFYAVLDRSRSHPCISAFETVFSR